MMASSPFSYDDPIAAGDLANYALKDGTNFTNPTTWLSGLGMGDITFTNSGRTQTFAAGNVDFTLASNGHFRINTSGTGMVGINTTTPVCALHVSTSLTTSPRGIMSAQYTTDALGARVHLRKARGTEAAPTVVVTGDDLGRIQWSGYDGNSYEEMASIRAAATGTIADMRVPTQLIFSTATDAAPSVLTDGMWFDSSQSLGIGAVPVGGVRLYVSGSATVTSTMVATRFNPGVASASGTGMWSPVSNELGFSIAGVEAVRIKSLAMGIGTTAPDKALEINSATGSNLRLTYNDSNGSAVNYADLSTSSGGNLTIAPSGGLMSVTGGLGTSVQSLSGAGAVNLTTGITEVTTTGAGDALTLANGVAGQEKTIVHGVDGGSFVLTPTTKTGWSTFTSTVAGESITLVYLTTRGWVVKGSYLGVIAP